MTDKEHRTEMLKQLAELWDEWPEQRLGQLIQDAVTLGSEYRVTHTSVFYITDVRLLVGIEECKKVLK